MLNFLTSLVNNLLLLHLVVYKLNIFIVANTLNAIVSYTQYLVGSISKQILFSFYVLAGLVGV